MAIIRLEDHPASSGEVGRVILAIAGAGRLIAGMVASEPYGDDVAAFEGALVDALRAAPVRWVAPAGRLPLSLDPAASLAVAIIPVDRSSNREVNAPMGTIFSVVPAASDGSASFLRPGDQQVAAGLLIYGQYTALALTVGDGTHLFVLDQKAGGFVAADEPGRIALEARDYAIDGSNERHWDAAIGRFAREFREGADGPLGRDFATSWIGSPAAETYRILRRGGLYLAPGDSGAGQAEGRLLLVHEANPIAWLIEEAGGAATDGRRRILDLVPRALDERVPLAFGAVEDVSRLGLYYGNPEPARHEPLFATRTLFRGQGGIGARSCR